jgi:hypothetical protein
MMPDLTNGATYYYAISIPAPVWLPGARWCGQFGSQLFWKDVR